MKAILSCSGKGGVGKTVAAVSIARKIRDDGHSAGLCDIDLDSANVSEFLGEGSVDVISVGAQRGFRLAEIEGLQVFSMGYLVGISKGISMKGAGYAQFIKDVFSSSNWNCEYLVVDCPPGSSDEFKSVVTALSDDLLGSIITVQPAHITDAERILDVHFKNDIQILGIVENMTAFHCEKCGCDYPIFGESMADKLAEKYGVPVLGRIPLSMEIRHKIEKKEQFTLPLDIGFVYNTKPRRPGFFRRTVDRLKDTLADVLAEFVIAVNQCIPIADLQVKYGFIGGRVTRLNIMDENMEVIKERVAFRIRDGKLNVVELHDNELPDIELYIKPRALAWAYFGERTTTDGRKVSYTLLDALLNGDAEYRTYGGTASADAIYFINGALDELREKAGKLESLMRILA